MPPDDFRTRPALPDQRRPARRPLDGRDRLPPARREPAQGRPRRRRRAQPHPHRRGQHRGGHGGGHGRAQGAPASPWPPTRRRSPSSARACQGVLPSDDQVHAVADIGADQLTVVVHQGGQPRFIRTIANLGGDTATVAVAERLRIDADEAEELKRETGLNGPAPVVAPIAESSVFGGLALRTPRAARTPRDVRHGRRPQPLGDDRDRRDPQLARLLPGLRSDRTHPDADDHRPHRRARRTARAHRDPDPPQRAGHGPAGRPARHRSP